MKCLVVLRLLSAAAAVALYLGGQPPAGAQQSEPVSRGENFSDKPAPQLFASDCTGSNCHKGPQGLAKGRTQGSLAGFLREHYTNSRESAAALATYLMKIPSAPAASQASSPRSRPGARSSRAAARSDENSHPVPPGRVRRSAQSGEASSKSNARPKRGRQVSVPALPEPPPPKQFDIFD